MPDNKKILISLYVDEDLLEQMKLIATSQDRSYSSYIRQSMKYRVARDMPNEKNN